MKAVVLREYGGPEVLSVEDTPMPTPGKGDVLVKVDTVGVGKPDVLFRTGSYPWAPPLPLVIGNEMSGRVVEVGEGVTGFSIGQAVYAVKTDGGCCAEFVLVPAHLLIKLPSDMDIERYVGSINFLLAYCLLYDAAKPTQGQTLYLNGASGGAGIAIIQMAKQAGLQVIAGCSSDEKCEFTKQYGADHVINYSKDNVVDQVLKHTHGSGVHLILDQYVGAEFCNNFDMLVNMGQIIIYNYVGGMPPEDSLTKMAKKIAKCPSLRWFSLHYLDGDIQKRSVFLQNVINLLAEGALKNPIFARYPLASASFAHRLLDEGKVRGKLVLKPGL